MRQISKYLVVGILNTAIGLSVILLLRIVIKLDLILANVLGYGTGLTISFVLNGFWTFEQENLQKLHLLLFAVLVLISFSANLVIINYLVATGSPYFFAQTAGAIGYSLLLFLGMKYVIYRFGHRGN